MPPLGRLGATLWLSRAMILGALEPRPPGKRWLVAGLGNPGLPGTRHSVGLAVLGQLAQRLGVADGWARDRHCAADLALGALGDAQLILLRPRRLMNANGRSVARAGELRAPEEAGREGAGARDGVLGGGRSVHLQVPVELQLLHMAFGTCRNLSFFVSEMGLLAVPPHESCESGPPPWADGQ